MREEQKVNHAIDCYADMVRRICMVHLKNYEDTEDIFQTVFLKYALSSDVFSSKDHEKAWLIRVTMNACKDLLRNFFRRHTVSLEEVLPVSFEPEQDHLSEVWEAVLSLPEKYKNVVYLFYYEGYSAAEIGQILGKKENTVYTLLHRAREILKGKLGGERVGEPDKADF